MVRADSRARAAAADDAARVPASPREQWGRLLSWVFHPFLLGFPALVAVGVARQGFRWSLMPAVGAAVLVIIGGPALGLAVLIRMGLVDDFFVSVRRQRIYLYPLLLGAFLGGELILYRAGVEPLVVAILVAGTISLIVAGALTLWVKLSLHCAGMAGLVVGFVAAFGSWWWLTLLSLVPTAFGRLWARGHTVREVVIGSVYGVLAMWGALQLLLGSGWFG